MFMLVVAFLTPVALLVAGLHRLGAKAIERGEYDAKGRRITAPAQAPLGDLVHTDVDAPVAGSWASADAVTTAFDDVDTLDMLNDLPVELVERIEHAISQRVQPHLYRVFEQGVRAGMGEWTRRNSGSI